MGPRCLHAFSPRHQRQHAKPCINASKRSNCARRHTQPLTHEVIETDIQIVVYIFCVLFQALEQASNLMNRLIGLDAVCN